MSLLLIAVIGNPIRGVAAIAATLLHLARDDGRGLPLKPEQQAAFVLWETDTDSASVSRREAEPWLARHPGQELLWIKLEAGAAVLAIVAAFS